MQLESVEIPYGAYWSTPFARWQGSFQHLHAMRFAAHVAKSELQKRQIGAEVIDFGVFGLTIGQFQSFMGAPWPLHEMGLTHVTGPTISQVCATGARVLQASAAELVMGGAQVALALAADRTSNGPHIYYPAPGAAGGTGQSEDQVLYNFAHDPVGGHAMLTTAENVARKYDISTEQQHEVVLLRYGQYLSALADDRAFHKRFMTLPFEAPKPTFKGVAQVLEGDEGIFPSTAEGLAKLKPVLPDGVVTFGAQTYPADGNCGMLVAGEGRAREISRDPSVRIRLRAFGQHRADLGYMPEAPIGASAKALAAAGVAIKDVKSVKSHNPFAVNDIAFSRATGFPLARMNNYGCSLIWGHPQGPTGLRAIIELIEELVESGGGLGLFQGCAAGDSSMAVLLEVSDR